MQDKIRTIIKLAFRYADENARDHHLWNNNGTYWMHYTVHYSDFTAQRVRRSLRTRDLEEACLRRDAILAEVRHSNPYTVHEDMTHVVRETAFDYQALAA